VGRLLVGVSGWTYPHWRGRFYPDDLPPAGWLAFAAAHFPTVEVNGTFYSLKRPHTFEAWRAAVPPELVFAVKASRYITHMRKLGGGAAPLANFFAQGLLLFGRQLGPILWQLPPQLPFHAERVAPFLRLLPVDVAEAERLARRHDARLTGRAVVHAPAGRDRRLRHAFEVRHESWLADEALALMREHDVALVTADTAGRHPRSLVSTAGFRYARLHGSRRLYGSRYTDVELDEWAAQLRAWGDAGHDVYVYFDNDNRAYAPHDALRLRARLGPHATESHPHLP
jgi:uncharacterized protein YecE (DUF72 family)